MKFFFYTKGYNNIEFPINLIQNPIYTIKSEHLLVESGSGREQTKFPAALGQHLSSELQSKSLLHENGVK